VIANNTLEKLQQKWFVVLEEDNTLYYIFQAIAVFLVTLFDV